MDEERFENLIARVSASIQKQDTVMSISPQERLVVTLRYLASGMSYEELESYHKIDKSTPSLIIPETCKEIYNALKVEFLKVPTTTDEWKAVATRFHEKWDFPHCLGAIDGKHIRIENPTNSGSNFFNYKKLCSVVLMSIVDADYRFLFVDVGTNGKVPDGAIYQNCLLAESLVHNTLDIPNEEPMPGFDGEMSYVFVGDDAFPLKKYLMKHYPQRDRTLKKRVFNYRLSRASRMSENAFGILTNRFRIFQHPIPLSPEKIDDVVLAAVCLHNFLTSDEEYIPLGFQDTEAALTHNVIPGTWRQDGNVLDGIAQQGGNRSTITAQTLRDRFADYFCGVDGQVPWQWRKAVLGDQ